MIKRRLVAGGGNVLVGCCIMEVHDGRVGMQVTFRQTSPESYLVVNLENARHVGIFRCDTPVWAGASTRCVLQDRTPGHGKEIALEASSIEQAMDETTAYFRDLEYCTSGCGRVVERHRACEPCTIAERGIEAAWDHLNKGFQEREALLRRQNALPENHLYVQIDARFVWRYGLREVNSVTVLAADIKNPRDGSSMPREVTLHELTCPEPVGTGVMHHKIMILDRKGCLALRNLLNEQFPPEQE